jgi:16S rRNA processing protein RimM
VSSDDFILLGKIIKSQSFDGALVISLESNLSDEIEDMESVFVEVDGILVPFFIKGLVRNARLMTVVFDDYESKERVTEFIGCRVYIDKKYAGESDQIILPDFLTGFNLMGSGDIVIGKIVNIEAFPMQVMLTVQGVSGTEMLIPYHDDWVVNIDKKRMLVILDLPDGILSVNQ